MAGSNRGPPRRPVLAAAAAADVLTVGNHQHGLVLWPQPSRDPKDPLRWPRWAKLLALISMSLFNFTANFAGAGLSVATTILEGEFGETPQQVNSLLTFNFLLLGVGNMIWVPLSVKFGKRPIMLVSMTLLFAVLIWTAKATSFRQLLIARCLSGFVSAAGESIVPGVVSDIFFLHERGTMMSIYVMLISGGTAVGPLIAGFMVQHSPGTWRDFVWLCAALAGFNLLAIFIFYPESSYGRPPMEAPALRDDLVATGSPGNPESKTDSYTVEDTSEATTVGADQEGWAVVVSYPHVWTSFIRLNRAVSLPKAFAAPFVFLLSVPVVWTVLVYGSALASQIIIIFAFPSLLLAPPYLFAPSSVGVMQVAAIIGFTIACYSGGYICDVITGRMIIRNRGIFVPEQRLVSLIPGSLIAPAGCILIAFACSRHLHWAAIAVGFGMVSFGTVYAPNIAMTYLVDCYPSFAQEILVAVNTVKNIIAFLFAFVAVDWTNQRGWIQVYMIMFMVVALVMVMAVPLYFWGPRARARFEKLAAKALGAQKPYTNGTS